MTSHRPEGLSERMTSEEAGAVLRELALRDAGALDDDLRTMPRIEDVAEALHLEPDDVRELLARVRATPAAVASAPHRRLVPYLGWALAAVALVWIALRPAPVVVAPATAPSPPLALGQRATKTIAVVPMSLAPPAGYEIGVRVHGVVLSLAGRRDAPQGSKEEVARQLAESADLLIQRAEEIGAQEAIDPQQRPSFPAFTSEAEVWIDGPGGANVSFPLPTEMHTGPASVTTLKSRLPGLRETIRRFLGATATGPESGSKEFTFPPSGFELRLSGRRRAVSTSGPTVVPDLDPADARDRLFRAMRQMLDADLKPLQGRWRQDREKERALRAPAESRFVVETLQDEWAFDVPTAPGTRRTAQDRVLRSKAAEVVAAYLRGRSGA